MKRAILQFQKLRFVFEGCLLGAYATCTWLYVPKLRGFMSKRPECDCNSCMAAGTDGSTSKLQECKEEVPPLSFAVPCICEQCSARSGFNSAETACSERCMMLIPCKARTFQESSKSVPRYPRILAEVHAHLCAASFTTCCVQGIPNATGGERVVCQVHPRDLNVRALRKGCHMLHMTCPYDMHMFRNMDLPPSTLPCFHTQCG
jgi:hypothetical protein